MILVHYQLWEARLDLPRQRVHQGRVVLLQLGQPAQQHCDAPGGQRAVHVRVHHDVHDAAGPGLRHVLKLGTWDDRIFIDVGCMQPPPAFLIFWFLVTPGCCMNLIKEIQVTIAFMLKMLTPPQVGLYNFHGPKRENGLKWGGGFIFGHQTKASRGLYIWDIRRGSIPLWVLPSAYTIFNFLTQGCTPPPPPPPPLTRG
jgi:hypothetical protein